jgi:hypothetical protein
MAAETLQEYLVKIGFKVDKASESDMLGSLRNIGVQAKLVADAIEGAVKAFASTIANVATGLEDLYYTSQRTQASVAHIQAMGRAAAETGSSVEAFTSTLEAFRRKARETGGDNWQRGFTNINAEVWKTLDGAQKLEAFIKGVDSKYKGGPGTANYASKLAMYAAGGVTDEKTIQAVLSAGYDNKVANNERMSKATGLDPEQAAKDSAEFLNTMRKFGYQLDAIWADIESKVVHEHGKELQDLLDWFKSHAGEIATALSNIAIGLLKAVEAVAKFILPLDKAITQSVGWKNAIEGIAAAIALLTVRSAAFFALRAPAWALGLLGLSGVAAVGAGAAAYGILGSPTATIDEARRVAALHDAGIADNRTTWEKWAPKWFGGRDAPSAHHHNRPGHPYVANGGGDYTSSGTLKTQRERFQKELDANPALRDKVLSIAAGENMNKDANVSVIETMMNRAAMAGTSLAAQATLASQGGYYAGYNPGALNTRKDFLEDSLNKALGGSNVSNYATGNASGDFVRNKLARGVYSGGLRYKSDNGEYFVGEDRGRGYQAWLKATKDAEAAAAAASATPRYTNALPDWKGVLGITPAQAEDAAKRATTAPNFGGLDGARRAITGTPLGAPSIGPQSNNTHINPVLNQNTHVSLYGVGDGHEELGAKVARLQNKVNADLIRNMQTASVA